MTGSAQPPLYLDEEDHDDTEEDTSSNETKKCSISTVFYAGIIANIKDALAKHRKGEPLYAVLEFSILLLGAGISIYTVIKTAEPEYSEIIKWLESKMQEPAQQIIAGVVTGVTDVVVPAVITNIGGYLGKTVTNGLHRVCGFFRPNDECDEIILTPDSDLLHETSPRRF